MFDVFTKNPIRLQLVPSWDSQSVDLLWKASSPDTTGFNVYRAQGVASNFQLITPVPINVGFFKDATKITTRVETPTKWVEDPDSATGTRAIRCSKTPMVRASLDDAGRPVLATPSDIVVTTKNGTVLKLENVQPHSGLIIISREWTVNESYDYWNPPASVPSDVSTLTVKYNYVDRFTDSSFGRDLYYKVTELSEAGETPLDEAATVSNLDLNPISSVWLEAITKTRFIFDTVGEPAYVLLKKTNGQLCTCVDPNTVRARVNCKACYGVGYKGGYDGPYPITFTPPNAATSVKQGPDGKKRSRTAQSFLGPTPILNSEDIIIRFNGERLVVTEVERTSIAGSTLQQSYTTEIITTADPRYFIPLVNPNYPAYMMTPETSPIKRPAPVDPTPSTSSLQEGVTTVEIADPEQDISKDYLSETEDMRTNTTPSKSRSFENWDL